MSNIEKLNEMEIMPLIPLRGAVLFPYMVLHFDVGREKSIKALEQAMVKDQLIFLTTQHDVEVDLPTDDDYYKIGVVAKVKQMLKMSGDNVRVLVEGIDRAEIVDTLKESPYIEVGIIRHKTAGTIDLKAAQAYMRKIVDSFEQYVNVSGKLSPDIVLALADMNDVSGFADIISAHLALKLEQKQELLETFDLLQRLEKIYLMLLNEIEILDYENQISEKVRVQINQVQKEFYLKEQLKVIKRELGEENDHDEEVAEFYQKLKKLKANKDIKEKVEKEIDRFSHMATYSAESTVTRTYLNWIFDLPWKKSSKDVLDIAKARKILDQDHYGLKDVKERVLEYLAVKKMAKNNKGSIICLVGPPGVGKTSIAKSVARALGRKFTRMSLGGVRDEAEIRGHRRTYIGAIPGRIISGIKETGTDNPVFLFDEIDKLANDFRGDPASALLEVLDPAQNNTFMDHYLEIPFDLSKVMFLTTANSVSTIPRALLDRMEVIEVPSYTALEKLKIAERYLLPKQREEHGLTDKQFTLSRATLAAVIEDYTREAGVRNLERQIAKLCRKAVTQIIERDLKRVTITQRQLMKYLGRPRHHDQVDRKEAKLGIVTGLAWTSVGGDTLEIEVSTAVGTGKLELTGQMGDVMKESAKAGFSYIRSRSKVFGLADDFYKNLDIHIHIPEGAVPKDGPSAGITMATAMTSALTGVKVKSDVAMTGEITLRGRVLAIGGLKEKVIAAARDGIKTIILPESNQIDIDKIPDEVRKNLTFVTVSSMDEVLDEALVGKIKTRRKTSKK